MRSSARTSTSAARCATGLASRTMRPSHIAHVAATSLARDLCAFVAQAPPPERKTARRNGVINVPKNGKVPKDKEERDPQLPTSVPMPSAVSQITDAGMRAMWDRRSGRMEASHQGTFLRL